MIPFPLSRSCIQLSLSLTPLLHDIKGHLEHSKSLLKLYTLVKVMLVVVIYVGFVIQEYVIIDMLWPVVKDNIVKLSICSSSKKCVVIGNYAFRSLLVTIAMIVALAVPRLETIIPLVGICSSMLLAFVIPATLDTVTFLPCLIHTKASKWRIARKVIANVLLITMGLFGLIAGLRTSILELINGA
ncbi:unnamed protein product [Anisakis simplex]|uniref:Aa_trans domain-containing protein n=1 Tax=Anisakis simplex TaxID=6269 RepID=A0A0M3J4B7_ANISI|nr:unnamed protein product [Anisakis simplex]